MCLGKWSSSFQPYIAVAILISIVFKWLGTRHSSDVETSFITTIQNNTEAINNLCQVMKLPDWQLNYKKQMEETIQITTEIHNQLDNSLSDLISGINNYPVDLKDVHNNLYTELKNTTESVSNNANDLKNSLMNVTMHIRNASQNIEQQNKTLMTRLKNVEE